MQTDGIQEIQSKVDAERAQVAALDGQLSDSGLKKQLQQATSWLDDVENIFLLSARQEKRTPEALGRWLSYAVVPLDWAIQRRKQLQRNVANYGHNAQTIG